MPMQRDRKSMVFRATLFVAALALLASVNDGLNAGDFPLENSREARLTKAKIRAAVFLSKATFGPTEESIDDLAIRITQIGYKRATSEWIDQQFELPATSHEQVARDIVAIDGNVPDMQSNGPYRYRYQAWWHIALTSEDQLRQRVAWALSQIFVIGSSGGSFNNDDRRAKVFGADPNKPQLSPDYTITDWLGMSTYYDMLAQGLDGTYRETLEDVTYHPNMGAWLSSVRNRKANVNAGRFPDENYAREIMQLFSIGLYELHQDGRLKVDENGALIPTYDNYQIKELARLFTGFRYHHRDNVNSIYTGTNFGDPMQIYVREHDTNYDYSEDSNAPNSKTVFGTELPPLALPLTEQSVRDEISAGLDEIANHQNVPPFICRLLIQRLVKSNPSRAYVRRVTRAFKNNGRGVRGDWKAVIKAILTDPELYRGQRLVRRTSPLRISVVVRGTEYSRLREPVNRLTSLIRAMRPSSSYPGGYMMLRNGLGGDLGQWPYDSPSVFNYYLPDFQPPGDLIGYTPTRRNPYDALFAPEFQILNAVTSNKTLDRFRTFCLNLEVRRNVNGGQCDIDFHLEPEIELAADLNNLDEILQRFDLLLCNGSMSEATKTVIKDAVIAETTGRDYLNRQRVIAMLNGVLISPDCAVEQ